MSTIRGLDWRWETANLWCPRCKTHMKGDGHGLCPSCEDRARLVMQSTEEAMRVLGRELTQQGRLVGEFLDAFGDEHNICRGQE